MTEVINWAGDSRDGVYIGGGDPKDTNHTPLRTMAPKQQPGSSKDTEMGGAIITGSRSGENQYGIYFIDPDNNSDIEFGPMHIEADNGKEQAKTSGTAGAIYSIATGTLTGTVGNTAGEYSVSRVPATGKVKVVKTVVAIASGYIANEGWQSSVDGENDNFGEDLVVTIGTSLVADAIVGFLGVGTGFAAAPIVAGAVVAAGLGYGYYWAKDWWNGTPETKEPGNNTTDQNPNANLENQPQQGHNPGGNQTGMSQNEAHRHGQGHEQDNGTQTDDTGRNPTNDENPTNNENPTNDDNGPEPLEITVGFCTSDCDSSTGNDDNGDENDRPNPEERPNPFENNAQGGNNRPNPFESKSNPWDDDYRPNPEDDWGVNGPNAKSLKGMKRSQVHDALMDFHADSILGQVQTMGYEDAIISGARQNKNGDFQLIVDLDGNSRVSSSKKSEVELVQVVTGFMDNKKIEISDFLIETMTADSLAM